MRKTLYSRLPRFIQVLVDDSQRLNEYGRFMRLAMTFGTLGFLYKFGQTMRYLESEKHAETAEQKAVRREMERKLREELTKEAVESSKIIPPSDDHIKAVIDLLLIHIIIITN